MFGKVGICPKCCQVNYKSHRNEFKCECGYSYRVLSSDLLDKRIAPVLSILNKKGYSTLFSCEGHLYKKGSTSYIYFINKEDNIVLERYPLPETWFYDNRLKKFIIRSFYKSKKKRLDDIYKWAESLPPIYRKPEFIYGYEAYRKGYFSDPVS